MKVMDDSLPAPSQNDRATSSTSQWKSWMVPFHLSMQVIREHLPSLNKSVDDSLPLLNANDKEIPSIPP